jgi:4-hydroxy-tetrahydrodipicolinate synthase
MGTRRPPEQPAAARSERGRIRGVMAPVLTPFRRDLSPDGTRLARHCRWLLAQGCAGLAVFGTTSEANSLSVEEREALLEELLGAGIDAATLLPGTGCCALSDTVRLTRAAVSAGCAGVLMLPPFYYKGVSDDGLFRAFAEVIERVADERLRVYLYHIPPVAQVGISANLIGRLLEAYPRTVAGMKDSSGDWSNTKAMLDRFAAGGFDVFVGSERFLLANLRAGGAGCITATANVNPGAIVRLFNQAAAADAEAQQQDLNQIRGAVEKHPAIPALKAIVAHYTGDASWQTVRPPLTELAPEAAGSLLAQLRSIGFAMESLPG